MEVELCPYCVFSLAVSVAKRILRLSHARDRGPRAALFCVLVCWDLLLPAASATAAVADCLDPRRAVPGPRYRHLLPLCSAFDSAFLVSGGRLPTQPTSP